MWQGLTCCGMIALLFFVSSLDSSQSKSGRPAPSPSRYSYTLKMDAASLPPGVTAKENNKGQATAFFLANAGAVPLIFNETFQGDRLVGGTQVVSGKVLFYFPNGIPQEGKQHLKGWQSLADEIKETLITLPSEPATIRENRKPGVAKDIPKAEPFAITVKYNGKPLALKGTIEFHLNPAYDSFYAGKNQK